MDEVKKISGYQKLKKKKKMVEYLVKSTFNTSTKEVSIEDSKKKKKKKNYV
jgi:hypothetical protein